MRGLQSVQGFSFSTGVLGNRCFYYVGKRSIDPL